MNKFAKVCYDSYRCRRSIKIGVGFIIISLVLFAIPMGSLFAHTLSVPDNSGSDSNGTWVEYNVSDDTRTNYTWYPDASSTAIGISFEVGNGNSPGSFQSGFVGSGVYDNGYFTVTIAGSSADVAENDVLEDYKDIKSIKIYFESDSSSPSSLEWGQNGRDLADLSGCEEGYWHWILTPGGNATILTATLYVTYSDNSQTQTAGATRSDGPQGAFHFDVYNAGVEATSAYVEYTFSGDMNNPVLTISNSSCSEVTTTTAETTTTVGETTTTVGETTTTAGTTTTTAAVTTTIGEATTTAAVAVAGITDADEEGFIEVAGISELPYTGVNMWFLIIGILFVIGGALTIVLPKYRKRASH